MAEKSRGFLFRKRNILAAALAVGIGIGIYVGQWRGLGLGGGWGVPTGEGETHVGLISGTNPIRDLETKHEDENLAVPDVVRVVIDEESLLLRPAGEGGQDIPISLEKLMKLIEQAPGDADGLRVRIYEKLTARPTAEENLKKALETAQVPDTAIFWVPTPVE